MGAEFNWSQEQETQLADIQSGVRDEISIAKHQIAGTCPNELPKLSCHLRALFDRQKRMGVYLCTVTVVNRETNNESEVEVHCSGPERARNCFEANLESLQGAVKTEAAPLPAVNTDNLKPVVDDDLIVSPKPARKKPSASPSVNPLKQAQIQKRRAAFYAAKAAQKREDS